VNEDVRVIIDAVPALARSYVFLVEAADGDPGSPTFFAELAEYVADLLGAPERFHHEISACLSAVEIVAQGSEDAMELVGWAFLGQLSPDERTALRLWFGPETSRILDTVDEVDEMSQEGEADGL
jgi:hypothetical protein